MKRKRPKRRSFFAMLSDRLCEPATWAGMGLSGTGVAWNIWPDKWQAISGATMGVCGFMAMIMGQAQR